MNNKIYFKEIESDVLDGFKKQKGTIIVDLDGNDFLSYHDYVEHIEKVLKFPRKCDGNLDRYLDWMRDLSWLPYDKYVFIIRNYDSFLKNDKAKKSWFVEDFERVILPWWEYEVEKNVVGGEKKKMTLFLIE